MNNSKDLISYHQKLGSKNEQRPKSMHFIWLEETIKFKNFIIRYTSVNLFWRIQIFANWTYLLQNLMVWAKNTLISKPTFKLNFIQTQEIFCISKHNTHTMKENFLPNNNIRNCNAQWNLFLRAFGKYFNGYRETQNHAFKWHF